MGTRAKNFLFIIFNNNINILREFRHDTAVVTHRSIAIIHSEGFIIELMLVDTLITRCAVHTSFALSRDHSQRARTQSGRVHRRGTHRNYHPLLTMEYYCEFGEISTRRRVPLSFIQK